MYYVLKLTSLRFAFIAAVKRGRGPQAEQLNKHEMREIHTEGIDIRFRTGGGR